MTTANLRSSGRLAAATMGLGLALSAASAQQTAVTIYSTARPGAVPADLYRPVPGQGRQYGQSAPGYAMIRQTRTVELERGLNQLDFRDVAAYIDPTTVSFESLTAPATTRVVEQSFQFDLISTEKLMERYVDQQITVDQRSDGGPSQISGTLLSTEGGLILRGEDGRIHAVRDYQNVHFPSLPGGLITQPTLLWNVAAETAGTHEARVTYETAGLTWRADYNLVFHGGRDANSGTLDVGAWVSILNRSGTDYRDARLKLIAGDVQRVQTDQAYRQRGFGIAAMEQADMAGFEQQSFFEFHLYTLGRATTIPDDSTKQIELFPQVRGVPAERVLVYYGVPPNYGFGSNPVTDREYRVPMNTKVDVYLEFQNEAERGLGIPLPAGRIRVSQLDPADDSLEFIGEDVIDHTPRDETVRIRLGSAFDVVGERRQVEFRPDYNAERIDEVIEIVLRNHKEEPVEVRVRETMFRWTGNEVIESTHDYEREDARTVHFPVRIAADGETTLRYHVRYRW